MPDYQGFTTAVASAVKPDFADVVARAARRKRRWKGWGAAVLTLVVGAGGGAYALTAGTAPPPVKLAPVVRAWQTVVPEGGRAPQPQPSYVEIQPGFWDPAQRDEPLTGIFPSLMAGDLDHLSMEFQNCTGGPCKEMRCPVASCTRLLAVSDDRGRTWRKVTLPKSDDPLQQPQVVLVHHSLVVTATWATGSGRGRETRYTISTDGGLTWRAPAVHTVDALPAGWPVHTEDTALAAFDPATGDVARLELTDGNTVRFVRRLNLPPAAGLWQLGTEGVNVVKTVARVSQDGGRTWETRRLPDVPLQNKTSGGITARLYTADGTTVYLAEFRRAGTRIHVSTDGGRTWDARAVIDLGGPLMGVLPIDERTVIVQGLHGTYRSTDQGVTFTRVGDSLGGRMQPLPGGGFLINTNNNEYSAWISEDGAAWTYVRHPEVP